MWTIPILWWSWDQRWPFTEFSSLWRGENEPLWQWYPCSHNVQPEQTVDEVRNKILQKIKRKFLYVTLILLWYFRFQSDEKGQGQGFLLEYRTLDFFTACGGNYSNASGILSSPSYPNAYPEAADCVYLISLPTGTYVNISFLVMDVDCQGTPSDYIEIRDGDSEGSPLIGSFCGNSSSIPAFLQSTQNHLRIRWENPFRHGNP